MNESAPNSPPTQETIEKTENKYLELEKRKRKLVELFSNGLNSEDVVGYHGTSLESIKYLLEKGNLPGGTGEYSQYEHPSGHIYFFPLKSKISHIEMEKGKNAEFITEEKEAIEGAARYAGMISCGHHLLTLLGFELGNREAVSHARDLITFDEFDEEWESGYEYFLEKGIEEEKLRQYIEESKGKKGVVLSLSKNVFTNYKLGMGDLGEVDLDLHVPEGLHYDDLSGIEPLGEEEWNFFEKLQNEVKA